MTVATTVAISAEPKLEPIFSIILIPTPASDNYSLSNP
ncbi:hypothetical protein ACUXEV_001466 [Staphylococcus saprophyticus]